MGRGGKAQVYQMTEVEEGAGMEVPATRAAWVSCGVARRYVSRVQARALGPPCPSAASVDVYSPGIKRERQAKRKTHFSTPSTFPFYSQEDKIPSSYSEASTRLPPGGSGGKESALMQETWV